MKPLTLGFASPFPTGSFWFPAMVESENRPDEKDEKVWMRLPKPKERCKVTGLSRTSLAEILDEKDPKTGEPYVVQYRKERFGKQRKIRLIHKQSLLDYLDRRAKAQGLDWKPGINNPRGYTIEQVIESRELFRLFLGDQDPPLTDEIWEEGELSIC